MGILKSDKLEDVKSVLETLTVTVESINKSLSGYVGGRISPESLGSLRPFLQYIGNSLNNVVGSQNEVKALLVELNRKIDEARNSFENATEKVGRSVSVSAESGTPQIIQESFAPKIILDIRQKLNEIASEHSKEMELLSKQNEALWNKLSSIENQLNQFIESKDKIISKS